MTFAISDEHSDFRAALRSVMLTQGPLVAAWTSLAESGEYDPKWWARIADEMCIPALLVPESAGGQGRPLAELGLALEEAGRALVGGHLMISSGPVVALLASAAPGSDLLRDQARGKANVAFAIDGPSVHDMEQPPPSAARVGSREIVTGRTRTVVSALRSDHMLVAARRAGRSADDSAVVLLVDARARGVQMRPRPSVDPGRPVCSVDFDHVDAVVLAEGRAAGAAIARAWDVGATCVASESAGAMMRALGDLVRFTAERVQFGAPIGVLQAIRHRCADLLVEAEHALTASRYAAWTADSEPELFPLAASMAKAYACDAFEHAAREHLQLHGGVGFTMEHESHLFLRRAKSSASLFGSATWHRARILTLARSRRRTVHAATSQRRPVRDG
jgi:alkylation response protein AidB-like acyl-CoA dehydrogenase